MSETVSTPGGDRESGSEAAPGEGAVIWVTGLSSAGKTTLARGLIKRLLDRGLTPVLLDGNEVREALDITHQFDVTARRRMAFTYARLSRLLASQGHTVICATISLFHDVHAWNRARNPRYLEVFLEVPLEELQRRDTRDVYRPQDGAQAVGVGVAAEFPQDPDLVINNHRDFDLDRGIDHVLQACEQKGLTPPARPESLVGTRGNYA